MADFIQQYPYLIFTLLAILGLWILYFLFPRQRKSLLIATLFASPFGLASLVLVPQYWEPEYVVVLPWRIGIEDILFNYYMGGVAWLLSICLVGRNLTINYKLSRIFRRYTYIVLFGLIVGSPLYLLGFRPIDIGFIVLALWIGVLLFVRPSFWPLALSGACLGTVFAGVGYWVNLLMWPRISNYFNWPELWGVRIGGIPLEEYLYFALFCPSWALTTAFMLDARLTGSNRTVRRSEEGPTG